MADMLPVPCCVPQMSEPFAAPGQAMMWLQEERRRGSISGLWCPRAAVNRWGVGWTAVAGCELRGDGWWERHGWGWTKKEARRDAARELALALEHKMARRRWQPRRCSQPLPAAAREDDGWSDGWV